MKKKWTDDKLMLIQNYVEAGFTCPEIAKELDCSKSTIANLCKKQFGGNPNYRKYHFKHKDKYLPVAKYFVTHTAEETAKHFNLSKSEFKSIMTYAYRMPDLRQYRKDTRRKDLWTVREDVFLLRHAGLKNREWIAKKLKRGTDLVIKERMNKLGVASKNVNGITLSQFIKLFGRRPTSLVRTNAGPGRNGTPTYFKIITWEMLLKEPGFNNLPSALKESFKAMALFQKWIKEQGG